MRPDLFNRLPPSMALLLLTSLLDMPVAAHVLHPVPRLTQPPTTTIAHYALDVVSWPLQPTPPPLNPFDLRRRQDTNTICGFIGGFSALPATCSSGSHCVLDTVHGVVGCCPNGQDTCTAGVFTGCVDPNSGPQTEVNPYVFTCTGSDVCYKNVFDGGFSQFGCGTASDLATTVLATAGGLTTSLDRPALSVPFTQSVSTLSTPTTLGTVTSVGRSTRSSTSSSASSSTSSSLTSQSSTASLTSPISSSSTTTAPTDPPAAPTAATTAAPADRTGVIVGGAISGVAVLVALVAVGIFFLRRRGNNIRKGPGTTGGVNGQYISNPKPGPSTGFMAVNQDSDAFETGMIPPVTTAPPFSTDLTAGGPSPFAYAGAAGVAASAAGGPHNSYPPPDNQYHYPGQYPAVYAGALGGSQPNSQLDPDRVPLTQEPREIDDFTTGFHQALGRIGEEDEENMPPVAVNEGNGVNGAGGDTGSDGSYQGTVRPLWQQNRRQSRNLMWM
ncbi:hypothetical protein B0H63DRAFT_518555 [Podospora didyma]|uniref:Mid2 domain-containing protein n=1 Tax=Podospora didyma TaxID=330526 RepID=A0AAE0U3L4_9PEZI|nr:hypothetical protein B0H63DRAFT_518555 [Podospora didyma]